MRGLLSNDVARLGAVLASIVVVGWLAAMIAIFPDRVLDAPRAEVRGGNQTCDEYGSRSEAKRWACIRAASESRAGLAVVRELKRLAGERFVVAELVDEPEAGLLVSFTGDSVPAGAQAVVDKAPMQVTVRAGAAFGEADIKRIERGIGAALQDDPRYFHCEYDRVNERFEIQLLDVRRSQISYLRFSLPPFPDEATGHVHLRVADYDVAFWGGPSFCAKRPG